MTLALVVALVIAGACGACIGSFLNVCIFRLARAESVVTPPSRCYACGTRIAWHDNLPLLSYVLLRGRCRACGSRFSPRYLVIEALTAGMTVLVVWLGLGFFLRGAADGGHPPGTVWWMARELQPILHLQGWLAFLIPAAIATGVALVLCYGLIVATVTDLDYLIIPDEVTKGLQVAAPWMAAISGFNLATGIPFWTPDLGPFPVKGASAMPFALHLLAWSVPAMAVVACSVPLLRLVYRAVLPREQWWRPEDERGVLLGSVWFLATLIPAVVVAVLLFAIVPTLTPWFMTGVRLGQAVLGALTAWLILLAIAVLGTAAFRREAMGFGDFKFLAPIGALLGPLGVVEAFAAATVLGAVVGLPLRLVRARREIPFGPFLAGGGVVLLLWGQPLHQVLLRLLHPGVDAG